MIQSDYCLSVSITSIIHDIVIKLNTLEMMVIDCSVDYNVNIISFKLYA